MLFSKKTKFSIVEGIIKEDICDAEGNPILKLNIKYPDIKCDKKDKLSIFAKDFYKNSAAAFKQNILSELVEIAKLDYQSDKDNFTPFAAVMKYEITFEDKDFLSVMTDISVTDGKTSLINERQTQVWERQYGTKCKISYFLGKDDLKPFLKETDSDFKKGFNKELFILRDCEVVFLVRQSGEYKEIKTQFFQKSEIK